MAQDDLSNAFGAVKRDAVQEARAGNSHNPASGARAGAGAQNGATSSIGTPTTFLAPGGKSLHPFSLDVDDLEPDSDEMTAYLW